MAHLGRAEAFLFLGPTLTNRARPGHFFAPSGEKAYCLNRVRLRSIGPRGPHQEELFDLGIVGNVGPAVLVVSIGVGLTRMYFCVGVFLRHKRNGITPF